MTPSNQHWQEYEKDGKYYKTFRQFYKDGSLQCETTYIGKKKNGYMKRFHRNGNPNLYVEYTDNKMNGVFQRWYHCGQILMSGKYENRARVGTWTYWKVDGTVKNEVVYPVE